MPGITFQVLDCIVTIIAPFPSIRKRINDITVKNEGNDPVRHSFVLRIIRDGDGYRVVNEDQTSPLLTDEVQTVLYLHEWLYKLILFAHRDKVCLHAGCFSSGGKTGIVSGEKNAGKTTVLSALASEGATVFSDEYLLFGGGFFAPVPRAFHLKEKTLDVVPGLRSSCKDLIPYPSHYGGIFFFHDPRAVWDSTDSWPDNGAIFFIREEYQGPSRIEPCSETEMVKLLLTQILQPGAELGSMIKELCRLVSQLKCFLLFPGNLNGIMGVVNHAFNGTTISSKG